MQINLKQAEIIVALKHYIAAQGINLTGKSVTVSFTAGRKDSGISAELNIEEDNIVIPGYTDHEEEAVVEAVKAAPVLSVVQIPEVKEEVVVKEQAEEDLVEETKPADPQEPEAVLAPVKGIHSLFA